MKVLNGAKEGEPKIKGSRYLNGFCTFTILKSLVIISMMSVYLISTTELYQLVKLPMLVEHFYEHQDQDQDITLWEFLCMHYAHGDVKDADYDKDMKLPFKSHDGCSSSSVIAYIPKDFPTIAKPTHSVSKTYTIYEEQFLASSFLACIWQPPKTC